MRTVAIAATIMLVCTPAMAKGHHRHHHHHVAHHERHVPGHYTDQEGGKHRLFMCPGCVVRETLAGVISVSKENAEKFVGVINDLVKAGFKGPVDCASASGSHVPNSKHYSGNACDFDQCGWGCSPKIMHTAEAAAIIRKWGLTNGCSFRDCGHVGTDNMGTRYAKRRDHRHYAHHRRAHYAAG